MTLARSPSVFAAAPVAQASVEALLRRLEWTVLKRLDGLLQGDYRTLLRGTGVDLADLREYQYGDDVRHIDWNVTARVQQPHVRQFHEDRDLSAWFLLDLSASVHVGSGDDGKLGVSAGFVAALSRVLTRHGNRVGALFYGGGEPRVDGVLRPGASRAHVLALLARMRQPRPVVTAAVRSQATGTALEDLLHAAEAVVHRRSLVFVVSDFISTPGWEAALGRLARRHDVVAVRLWDPAENVLADLGLVTLEDAETGEQIVVDATDPGFCARYAALAESAEAALNAALQRAGVDTLELAADDDLLEALLRFADLRRRRAFGPGAALAPMAVASEPAAPQGEAR